MALDAARRARIIEAATVLFAAYGFRRTSMDQLAAEAGVAKPTLYAYFVDKQAVFAAVVDDVLAGILAEARAAAAEEGSLEQRITDVLSAKFSRVFDLVHSSPHAADLLASSEETSRTATELADEAYRSILTGVVVGASRTGEIDLAGARISRSGFVAALMQAGHGAAYGATSSVQHRRNLEVLARLLVAGVTRR